MRNGVWSVAYREDPGERPRVRSGEVGDVLPYVDKSMRRSRARWLFCARKQNVVHWCSFGLNFRELAPIPIYSLAAERGTHDGRAADHEG